MDLDKVAAQLQLGKELQADLAVHWDFSSAARKPGPIDFLEPPEIRRCCEYARLKLEIADQLIDIARGVAQEPALEALAWYLHWSLVSGVEGVEFGHWPALSTHTRWQCRRLVSVGFLEYRPGGDR